MPNDAQDVMLEAISDEVEELHTRMPDAELARHLEQRGDTAAPGTFGRAAWLSHAGEYWELAHQPARARSCYERAVQDGGPTWIDPRAQLLGVLFELGEEPRTEALLDELRRDVRDGRARGPVHEFVGETLELNGRPDQALRWFQSGLTRAQGDDDGCLNGRYRVRRALALPHDRYDAVCEERRRDALADLEAETRVLSDRRTGKRSARLTLLYWPAEQLDRLLARWPAMGEDYGADGTAHRATVERHLRELAAEGAVVTVGTGSVEEYVEFAERTDRDPADSATRAGYAAHLGFLGSTVAWPPGRNEPCWCASGLKYKKCCGALRFSAPDAD
jgi:hypothetical protein